MYAVAMALPKLMRMKMNLKHPTIWVVQDDQLKIYNGGKLIACIPDYQFPKLIVKLAEHLDSKE